MSELRDRLRRLRGGPDASGGAGPSPAAGPPPLPGGVTQARAGGLAHAVAARFPVGPWGRVPLEHAGPPALLQRWAGATAARALAPEEVVYLDTETTGLAGGTGTFVFLAGVGRFEGDAFEVQQQFLLGPQHEPAHLEALAERLAGARLLVSYNGASFDLPLVRTRFALHGLPDPLEGAVHLDLLPLARRLWRDALPDCRLNTVEGRLLGFRRAGTDVPGWEVPERYAAYLRRHDVDGLRGVLEHNGADVASLAALLTYLAQLVEGRRAPAPEETLALGRLCEAAGEPGDALRRYAEVAEALPEAAWRASLLEKRAGRRGEAEARWARLAREGHSGACVELAKAREHHHRDPLGALAYVARARAAIPPENRSAHLALDRREARLQRKRDGILGHHTPAAPPGGEEEVPR